MKQSSRHTNKGKRRTVTILCLCFALFAITMTAENNLTRIWSWMVPGDDIIGYIPMAFIAGLLYHRFGREASGTRKYTVMFVSMVLATAVLYILGTAWFMAQTGMTLGASLAACVIPFLPGDLIKIVAVMLVSVPIEAALKRTAPVSQGAA